VRSILIIQTAFFGDVILATALVEQLADAFPEAHIDMLVQKSREVLLANNPHIRKVLILDKSKKLRSTISLIKTIRSQRYDQVVNVHRHGTSGLLTIFSGAKETIGFDAHPLSRFFNRTIIHQRTEKHEIARNYELISHMIKDPIKHPKLYPSEADYKRVYEIPAYVTISPASVWETKRWPVGRWVGLIDKIPEHIKVFLLGGPGDTPLCQSIAEQSVRPTQVEAGNYSFLESAALMEHAVMNYTNDSAPVHMATAMNATVTTIFCSTIPAFGYGPLSDESHVMETSQQLDCRPCGIHGHMKCPQGHFKCADIEVSRVFKPLKDRLSS